jgi:hypothetical protein
VDAESAARRWADVLREAWPAGEIEAFIALYADDAVFRGPFGDPEPAVDHMRRTLSLGEPGPAVWVGEPIVVGDRAAVEWWAIIVSDGEAQSFSATAWLRFDAKGAVIEEHDHWHSSAGRKEPWPGWGRPSADRLRSI